MQISINLLPEEHRKKEMTPLSTLLPVLGCLTAVLAVGAFWAYMHFGQLEKASTRNAQLSTDWKERKPLLDYQAALTNEEREYAARSDTIQGIAASRVPWTQKLSQLKDVIAEDNGGDRYSVWLTQLSVKPGRSTGRRAKAAGDVMKMEGYCFSKGHPLQTFNFFHEAMNNSEFFVEDFASMNNPAGQAIAMDDGLTPNRAWTVKLELNMNPRGVDPKAGKGLRASANRK